MVFILLLVALIAPSIAQYCPTPSPCPSPSPPSQCDLNTNSMFPTTFVTIVPNIGNNYQLDNICHTFFPNKDDNCTFTAYYSFVYRDGSTKILNFIVTSKSPNSFSFASTECSFTERYIFFDGNEMVLVRNIDRGDCPYIFPVVVGYVCPYDGTTSDLPSIKQILASNGSDCTDLLVLPRALPYNCINSQPTSNTGSSVSNCPGQCPDSDDDTVSVASYPNYSYNSPNCPPYSYNPPSSGCGCSK